MMVFTTQRTILFGDCDPAGIVYTPRVSYFLIESVHEFLAEILGGSAVRELYGMGILPPARAMSIEFLAPMAWDDVIDINVHCQEIGNTSFTFAISGKNTAGDITFKGTLTQVCISPDTKRPMPLPLALRQPLAAYLPGA